MGQSIMAMIVHTKFDETFVKKHAHYSDPYLPIYQLKMTIRTCM
jgi:hypothetical protein